MQTFLMIAKKSTKKHKVTSRKSSTEVLTYETKLIIVVLLLLFFYPVGLIFMWTWMGKWPMPLRIIITLPVLLGIAAFFMLMVLLASAFHRMQWERNTGYMMQRAIQTTPISPMQQATTPATQNLYSY
jgi:hypothetical protein